MSHQNEPASTTSLFEGMNFGDDDKFLVMATSTIKLHDGTFLTNLRRIKSTSTSHLYSAERNGTTVYVKQRASSDERKEEKLKMMLQLASHPRLIELIDIIYLIDPIGRSQRFSFVMESVEGGDLSQVIRPADFEYSTEQGTNWICQIADGLMFLHANKIIHGNLKPKNILMFGEGKKELKLTDFGELRRLRNTAIPLWNDSYSYMAPEVLRYPEEKGIVLENPFPVDIYSLAVIWWEIIHKKPPFQYRSVLMFYANLDDGIRPNFEKNTAETNSFIESCWDNLPEVRPRASKVVDFVNQLLGNDVSVKKETDPEECAELETARHTEDKQTIDNEEWSFHFSKAYTDVKVYNSSDFVNIENLGFGSESTIFLGTTRTGSVCIKQYHHSYMLIWNEVEVLLNIRHENVINILGVYASPNRLKNGYVMEFMEGGDLHHVIHSNTRYTDHDVYSWTLQVSKALEYLHSRNLLHRDVKPRNMLLDANHKVLKLCDFGIAKQLDQLKDTAVCGTYDYMSPEVIEGGRYEYGYAVDVYSLGISTWETYHRRRPYEIKGMYVLCQGIVNGRRPILDETMNPDLEKIISKMWDADPTQRPNAVEVFETFKKFAEASRYNALQLTCRDPLPVSTEVTTHRLLDTFTYNLPTVSLEDCKLSGRADLTIYIPREADATALPASCEEFGKVTIILPHRKYKTFYEHNTVCSTCHKYLFQKLRHTNVVHALAFLCEKDRIKGYIIEPVFGTMAQVIYSRRLQYDTPTIYSWTIQLARAVLYLHRQGIIHQNIKPSSIYVTNSNLKRVQLGGLHGEADQTLTNTTGIRIPEYTAPEAMNGKHVFPSDVYSFAVTLWEIAHRKKPYDARVSPFAIAVKIGEGMRPTIDKNLVEKNGLWPLIERMWDGNPKNRPLPLEILDFAEKLQTEEELQHPSSKARESAFLELKQQKTKREIKM